MLWLDTLYFIGTYIHKFIKMHHVFHENFSSSSSSTTIINIDDNKKDLLSAKTAYYNYFCISVYWKM